MSWSRPILFLGLAATLLAQPPRLARRDSAVTGHLRRLTSTQLLIGAEDHRVMWYRLADDLKFLKEGKVADPATFEIGDLLEVTYNTDESGNLTATAVRWFRKGTPEEQIEAARTRDLPPLEGTPLVTTPETAAPTPTADEDLIARTTPATVERPAPAARDDDDPGRPVLRRGVTRERVPTAPAPEPAPATAPKPEPTEDQLLAKAREAAFNFTATLPNYFCQQQITRYEMRNRQRGFDPIDIVTVDVAYENGAESYKNVRINGKETNKPFDEIDGAQSTGEFGTALVGLFLPGTNARFRRGPNRDMAGRRAVVFDFTVTRENSNWRIHVPSQLFYPAYSGSIWIDRETGRVLRLEQHAVDLPDRFPYDTAELAIDYDYVRLSDLGEYLVPVTSEVLTCIRSSGICMKNHTEFRRYRKFGAETTIITQ